MISFVDFAPTILSMAGIGIPWYMQGIPFIPSESEIKREYVFAARDFHEGADFDTSRVVRSRRFHYIRNFMPHIGWDAMLYSWNQAPYMLEEWEQQAEKGNLLEGTRQACFYRKSKPIEELYDMEQDPCQMRNLVNYPEYKEILEEMRTLCEEWMIDNYDLGLLSQYELYSRSEQDTPYAMAADPKRNPVKRLLEAANVPDKSELYCGFPWLFSWYDGRALLLLLNQCVYTVLS